MRSRLIFLEKLSIVPLLLLLFLYRVQEVFASPRLPRVIQPENSGFDVSNLTADQVMETLLRNAITIVFTICSIGVVLIFLWGATDWIISGGDKDKVAAARKKITTALIGFALLALSFAITGLVGSVVGINPWNLEIPGLSDPV